MKNISEWLNEAKTQLEDAGIETARLDALILLEDVMGKDRTHLLAYQETVLTTEQENKLATLLNRRIKHEPMAYIRGKTEFYGREFIIDKHVLVPRPESEDILELLQEYGEIPTIIDVGTGSGALAVSVALLNHSATVYAIDIDPNCLDITRRNAALYGATINCIESDLLRPLEKMSYTTPLFILANLPYVPDNYAINIAAEHEPRLALFGGTDGLDLYRIMFDQLSLYTDDEIIVLTESLESQHAALAGIAFDHGFVAGKKAGLIQTFTYIP